MRWIVLARQLFLGWMLVTLLILLLLTKADSYFSVRANRQRFERVANLKQSLLVELGDKASRPQVEKWLKRKQIRYEYEVGGQLPIGGVIFGTIPMPRRWPEDSCAIYLSFSFEKSGRVVKQKVTWSSSGL